MARSTTVLLCVLLNFAMFANAQSKSPKDQAAVPAADQSDAQQTDASTQEAEPTDEELAPAAVQLDVSQSSPLIQKLYAATRETKEQPTLARLAEAKALLDGGADVKATDKDGRTALHWAIFGSSYASKPKIVVAYEGIADELISRGVDLNHEDIYQDTALDYLLYSPNYEMQTLLIENNATSGFLTASFRFVHQENSCDEPEGPASTVRVSASKPVGISVRGSKVTNIRGPAPDLADGSLIKADLLPGATMSIRLNGPVYSDRSRTGDPVEGTVTYPVCKNGEQLACKPGELLAAPGTKVTGTILFAQKAPDKYSRPRVVIDFSNIQFKDGQVSPLYARVIDVDNARETIRSNEILGIIQPHATTKVSIIMAAASAINPIAGYTIKGIQGVYGLSIRREIQLPSGTDMQVQVVRPSSLKEKDGWQGWPQLQATPELTTLVRSAPMRTHTAQGTPSDVTNLMFLGSREQLVSAFNEAGWYEADALTIKSALKTAQATMRQAGYSNAPVSTLLIEGRSPDLVFQKSLDTFAKRHHIRIWKLTTTYEGQEVWVGAATHDIAIDTGRGGTKWTHRIDPHIDRERDWVETDLLFIGSATGYADLERPAAPRNTTNATGDEINTDGKVTVVQVGATKNAAKQPALVSR
jgi:hypothetical protein